MAQGARIKQVEEQMATLIQMLETQNQRQEELAAEQKGQIQALTSKLEEQHYSMEEQHERVRQQQGEMEARVDCVQTDLRRMNAVMEEHMELTETRLGTLQQLHHESQAKHMERLGELHGVMVSMGKDNYPEVFPSLLVKDSEDLFTPLQSIKQEEDPLPDECTPRKAVIKAEDVSGKKPTPSEHCKPSVGQSVKATSVLRVGAPPFVHGGTDLVEQVEDGMEEANEGVVVWRQPMHRPMAFDGKSSWEAYCTQFELLADLNRWGPEQKASYLAVSLRGAALTVLTNLPAGQRRDYQALAQALQNRFGTGHQTELNRAKLRGRMRRREETLPALAEDVERLTRLAYPRADEAMVMTLSKDQFIDSLHDDEMKVKIRQLRPQTLQRALEIALELESYSLAGRQRSRPVREARLEGEKTKQRFQDRAGAGGNHKMLQKLQECLEACKQQIGGGGAAQMKGAEPNRAERRARATCWTCKQKGHYRWECGQQTPRARVIDRESTPPPGTSAPQKMSGNGQ